MERRFGSRSIAASNNGLQITRFETPQATSRDRHDAWISQGWPSVVRLCEFKPIDDFHAETKTVALRQMKLTLGSFGAQDVHRSRDMLRRAPIDHLLVTVPLDVAIATQSGRADPGSVLITDLSAEWQHRAARSSMITFPIPRAMALEQRIDPSRVHGTIIAPAIGQLLRDTALQIVRDAQNLPSWRASELDGTLVNLLAVGLAESGGPVRPTGSACNIALRLKAERHIMSSLSDENLSVTRLAEALGVSRAQLYRAFDHEDGLSKAIITERLYAAAHDLDVRSESIGEIAERYQFREYSHFSRAFLAEFGMRPREWRMRGEV